ncbi:hypothetical protein Bbelb_286150 [Branchiostoma belcheri]|nr:hypothetical protein Bbelb_286150 [Branchiostoma belcheri]
MLPRRESTKIASRYIRAAILDIVGNVRYRCRERSVAPRLPKRDRKLSDHNRKAYRAFPTAVADIPDYIQNGGADFNLEELIIDMFEQEKGNRTVYAEYPGYEFED